MADETAVSDAPVDEATTSPVETPPQPPVEPPTPLPTNVVEDEPWLDLSRGDRVVLGVLAVVCLGLSCWHWARLGGWGLEPIEVDRPPERRLDYKLDVNTATWVEWRQLPGIGDTLARRVVADRTARGPFATVEDVARVKGIGPKTLEKLRPWLTVEDSEPQP